METINNETICRVCLNSKYILKDIFNNEMLDNIAFLLMECAPVQIYPNDGFPSKICIICLDKLHIVQDFKLLLVNSDNVLRQLTDEKINICEKSQLDSEIENSKFDLIKEEITYDNKEIVEKQIKKIRKKSYKNYKKLNEKKDIELLKERENKYECDSCDRICSTKSNLKLHKQTHTIDKPHMCDFCGKNFRWSSYLASHRKIHTGEYPYECDFCHKRFIRNTEFKDHRRIHTGERPYICSSCGKSFKQNSQLRVHKRIHDEIFNFECDTCQKKFKTKDVMIKHKRIHTGERPYECTLCHKKFSQNATLFNHNKLVHKKLPKKTYLNKLDDGVSSQSEINNEKLKIKKNIHPITIIERNDQNLPDCNPDSSLKEKSDWNNLLLLYFLYVLQGIPIGLVSSIPLLLTNRNADYTQQAIFSFASWPFSLKLLWAPIIDAFYWKKFGRRKSWLIPVQFLIGFLMFYLSFYVTDWMGDTSKSQLNIPMLTLFFFILYFLAATQDIVVDGWALTMLSKKNVGYASTCNSTGNTTGVFLGCVVFMTLESPKFCNEFLRKVPKSEGIITMSEFLFYTSIVFTVTTTLIAIFKKEEDYFEDAKELENKNIKKAYVTLWEIIKLKPVIQLAIILLTIEICFGADAAQFLKIVEKGLPNDKIGIVGMPLLPLQVVLVFLFSRWIAGTKAFYFYFLTIPLKLIWNYALVGLVYITPIFIQNGVIPMDYYAIFFSVYILNELIKSARQVALVAFFAKISDPVIGGTYMTLLTTLWNLGEKWPRTLALSFIDVLTWSHCDIDHQQNDHFTFILSNNTCITKEEKRICKEIGGKCNETIDGFYVLTVICTIIGCFWIIFMKKHFNKILSFDISEWRLYKDNNNNKNAEQNLKI